MKRGARHWDQASSPTRTRGGETPPTMNPHPHQQQSGRRCFQGLKLWRLVWSIQVLMAMMVVIVMATSVVRLYSMGFFSKESVQSGVFSGTHHWSSEVKPGMVVKNSELDSVVATVSGLQSKVGRAMELIQSRMMNQVSPENSVWLEQNRLLLDVAVALDQTKNILMQVRITGCQQHQEQASSSGELRNSSDSSSLSERSFVVEEVNKYVLPRDHRLGSGKKNFMGANATYPSIGLACATMMRKELEQYMDYDVGDYCPDDWILGQKLMVHGCDPLPRRRCLARAPQLYQRPLGVNQSLWSVPDNRNVRWNSYKCKSFACLAGNKPGISSNISINSTSSKGFYKCSECFDLHGYERNRWMVNNLSTNTPADFRISEVLAVKPEGEIRIGLDFSVGTGSFAARMKEHNVTIISATLNLGAPFNEMISLRGLVPLYLSVNQRLPFFDNTLDILHTTLFLDGWIDHILLDFIIFDWDRVLRPGGLLWIDRFFCLKQDIDDYLYFFLQLHYKKHLWVVTPKLDKDGKELFFSAVLEKPPRPF